MPFARIDLAEGRTADYRKAIGEVVYDAQVEVLKGGFRDPAVFITELLCRAPQRTCLY
jgi:hypothetical protein